MSKGKKKKYDDSEWSCSLQRLDDSSYEICDVKKPPMFECMVDSGASTSALPPYLGRRHYRLDPLSEEGSRKWYRAANGSPVQVHGTRSLNVRTIDGLNFEVDFIVMDVRRPLLSVHQIVQAGGEVHFTPSGAWIKKGDRIINMDVKGNVYTIPLELLPPHGQQCFRVRHLAALRV